MTHCTNGFSLAAVASATLAIGFSASALGQTADSLSEFTLGSEAKLTPAMGVATGADAADNKDFVWTQQPGTILGGSNDLCADAIPVDCGSVVQGSTANATFDDVGVCGTSNTAPGVWYSLSGLNDGDLVSVTTCSPNSNYDTKITVFSGDCGNLVCVGGNDDASCAFGGLLSTVNFSGSAGTTYLILVHGFSSAVGDFELSVNCEEPPPPIDCPKGAIDEGEVCDNDVNDPINGGCNSTPPVFGSIECGDTICGTLWATGGFRDLDWFEFSVGSLTNVTWTINSNLAGGAVGGRVFIATASCPPTVIATDAGPSGASVSANLAAGTYYLITAADAFEGAPCGTGNDYLATVTCDDPAPGPDNDFCDGAIDVACGESVLGSTSDATGPDAAACGTSVDTAGVWYHLVGTGDIVTVDTCSANSNYDTKLSVYSGSCDNLVCVGGNDDAACAFGGLLSRVTFISDAGTDYYILVHGFGSATGDFELNVTCEEPPPPIECPKGAIFDGEVCDNDVNDPINGGCNSTPPVFGEVACGDTICGTLWATDGFRDLDWFEFTLANPATVTFSIESSLGGGTVGGRVFIASANCPPVVIVTDAGPAGATVSANLGAGTYYLITAADAFEGAPCGTGNEYLATVTCEEVSCDGDLDGDGVVGPSDLLQLVDAWGPCDGCDEDLNGDGVVNFYDVLALLGDWGCTTDPGDPPDPNSCEGNCGGQAPGGCFCDQACFGFSDCCADICDHCDFPECGGGGESCVGSCGGQSPDGCFCDEKCFGFSDCCPDVCDACPDLAGCGGGGGESCVGSCGGQSPDGCFCDDACFGFSDCCPDVCDACPDLAGCGG